MKLSESLSFDVYNMHAKAGKWVFRAPECSLKRGVTKLHEFSELLRTAFDLPRLVVECTNTNLLPVPDDLLNSIGLMMRGRFEQLNPIPNWHLIKTNPYSPLRDIDNRNAKKVFQTCDLGECAKQHKIRSKSEAEIVTPCWWLQKRHPAAPAF